MTNKEFTSEFNSYVKKFSRKQSLLLALSVCKRLYFDYQVFSDQNNWGDPDLLMDGINLVERSFDTKLSSDLYVETMQKIQLITPDTEDFGGASYALNACGAVYETLKFLVDNKIEHIMNIGTYLTDTVDSKIQEDEDLKDSEIDAHTMMIDTRNFLLSVK